MYSKNKLMSRVPTYLSIKQNILRLVSVARIVHWPTLHQLVLSESCSRATKHKTGSRSSFNCYCNTVFSLSVLL